jgi:hypothetical protein
MVFIQRLAPTFRILLSKRNRSLGHKTSFFYFHFLIKILGFIKTFYFIDVHIIKRLKKILHSKLISITYIDDDLRKTQK